MYELPYRKVAYSPKHRPILSQLNPCLYLSAAESVGVYITSDEGALHPMSPAFVVPALNLDQTSQNQ